MAAPMILTFVNFCLFFIILCVIEGSKDEFNEEMFIKPLESGHVYTHFQFTTTWDVNIYDKSDCKLPEFVFIKFNQINDHTFIVSWKKSNCRWKQN